jgi:endo-1,4-beta-xylanase
VRYEEDRVIEDGTYMLLSGINQNFALDVQGGGMQPAGTRVQLWERNNTGAQRFEIRHHSDGLYTIRNVGSGRFLDVTGRSTNACTRVVIWDNNGHACNQLWRPIQNGEHITFVSGCSDTRALDAYGGVARRGTDIAIWSRNTTPAQLWTLHRVQ